MDGEGRRKQSLHTQNGTVLETDMALALGAAGKCSVAAKGGGGLEQHPHLCPDPHGLARAPVLPGAPRAAVHVYMCARVGTCAEVRAGESSP